LLTASLLLCLASGLLWAACGGGSGDESAASDGDAVPTATLPDPLPEARILGEAELPTDGTTYVVRAGDNLSDIAEQFGTTAEAIAEANNLADPTRLEVGQRLVIPGAGQPDSDVLPATVEPPSEEEPTEAPAGETEYIVRSGDVAALIAERFGITVEELAEANNTTIDDLRSLTVGEKLIIPAPSPAATPEP
jgi:LysM repeat protein